MSEKPTPIDRALSHKVVQEMRELRDIQRPDPAPDWDTIWVFSASETTFDEEERREGKINENRQRLETGFDLLRRVTAVRLGKKPQEISLEEIAENGPTIYYNGVQKQNEALRRLIENKEISKKFQIPENNIRLTGREDIKHTGDQFVDFPKDLAEKSRRIVLVSNIYHLPRIRRYPFAKEKVVLYPVEDQAVGVANALREAKKIPEYIKVGILPPEEEKK